ncbi:MAG: hypothetical protein AAF399_06305 [Bacteroidota bacterium]
MRKSIWYSLVFLFLVISFSGCLKDESLIPQADMAQEKAHDLSLETEETSAEFRAMFLEVLGINTLNLPEATELKVLAQLKSNMDGTELAGVREAVIAIAKQKAKQPTHQAMSLLRTAGPLDNSASDGTMADGYGTRIATKDDEVFVGAPGSGQVYVNAYVNETLTETQILTPSMAVAGFGSSVAVSGFSLLVGVQGLYDGYVFVFEKQNGSWVETQVIYKDGGLDFARVLEINAQYFVTGFRDTTKGFQAFALIYRRNDNSGMWEAHQEVPVSTVVWDADFFDKRLVVSGVAAPVTAAFHVIERTGQTWAETAFVPVFGVIFPRAIATHNQRIVINGISPFNNSYVYKQVGGAWIQEDILSIPGIVPFAQTRWVDIDGNRAVVSVPAYGGGDAVYEYQRSGSDWSLIDTHTPASGDDKMWFGEDLKIKGKDILIGAPGGGQQFDPTPADPGKLYIY